MRVPPPQHGQDPRRRMPRHATDVVRCPLGEVVDLSGTGVRVAVRGRCPLKEGQSLNLPLQTPHGRMTLPSRVMWRKRTGLLGGCVLGLDFVGIKPNQSVVLATIARFGFVAASEVKSATGGATGGAGSVDKPERIEADLAMAPYFAKLALTPQASAEQVKDAYRKLARQYHPDVAPGPENQAKFVELREAYQLLSDHLRRAG
ncbi:MAG: DnaJ domain-containing protein [Planctomycetota bacterium]